jgi:thiamine biosynthesis lipoprotein
MLGSPFEMIVEAKDIPEADTYIDMAVAEVSRLENLISDWIPTTPISDVNRNAGIKPIKVPQVFDLVQRSIKISELTSGAFDISYASMDKIGNLMEA